MDRTIETDFLRMVGNSTCGVKFEKVNQEVSDLDSMDSQRRRDATDLFAMPNFFDAPKKKKGKHVFFAELFDK